MPAVTLTQTYIYAGKFYGPGEADVPDELAQKLATAEPSDKGAQQLVTIELSDDGEPKAPKPVRSRVKPLEAGSASTE